jgi:hypothetical protein
VATPADAGAVAPMVVAEDEDDAEGPGGREI